MTTNKKKITTQKVHKVARDALGVLCSKYSPSQKIDRSTYDLCTRMKGIYCLVAVEEEDTETIANALTEAGIKWNFNIDEDFSFGINILVFQ